MRHCARTDQLAHATVLNVDQMRLAFFNELFRNGNFSKQEARSRGYIAYAVMMGDLVLKQTVDVPHDFVDVFVAGLMPDHAGLNSVMARAIPARGAEAAAD